MEFIKKHYEKILLALVLLGLVAAVGYLLIIIPEKQQKLKDMRDSLVNKKPTALLPLNTQVEDDALQRLQTPVKLDFTSRHKLFNPVLWRLQSSGNLQKIDSPNQVGPEALVVVAINPLYLTVSYVQANDSGYVIRLQNPTLARPADRTQSFVIHSDAPSPLFNLVRVTGTPEHPDELQLEFKDTHERFALPADPDRPFKKVAGYMADLRYPPDASLPPWNNMRPGALLTFDGAQYSVFDVQESYVVISTRANNKHTTIFLGRTSESPPIPRSTP